MLPTIISDLNTVTLLAQINILRHDQGQSKIQNSKFNAIVRDECPEIDSEMLSNFATISDYHKTTSVEGYPLTPDQAILIGMRVSKSVRRGILRWIRELEQKVSWEDAWGKRVTSWERQRDAVSQLPNLPEDKVKRGYFYGKETNIPYAIVTGLRASQLIKCPHRECQAGMDPSVGASYLTSIELYWVDVLQNLNAELCLSFLDRSMRVEILKNRYANLRNKQLED